MPDHTERDYFERRRGALRKERASFIAHYKELAQYVKPRRGRFETSDRNKGDRRHNFIINSRATQALRIAGAGMLAGTMSPARPWFAFSTFDLDLLEFAPVKVWLARQELLIRTILNSGNFYNMVSTMLGELLLFGTGCMTHVDDFEDVARFYTHTVGSYLISQNDRFIVDTLVREFERTVEQLVSEFGLGNVSKSVENMWDRGRYDQWIPVVHFIEPNPDIDITKDGNRFKPFRSRYYEPGNNDRDSFLKKSGFGQFPGYCPRWDVTGEDVYGTDCPGMTALGDIKSLQIEEKRKAQAIDKMVNPPLHGPASLRNVPISSLPGGSTLYDGDSTKNKLEPIYTVNPQLQDLALDIERVERRIDTAFFVDMFLAISNMEGIQPRNQLDLSQRNEERLLQLGPALQRVHAEFLAKMVDRIFIQGVEAGIIHSAPVELQGQELDIKFISTLALAQRSVAVQEIERTANYVASLRAAGFEEVADKFDANQSIDEFSTAIGAPPKIIVPDEIVQQKQAARAQQQQLQLALQSAESGSKTLKNLGETRGDPGTALGAITESIEQANP